MKSKRRTIIMCAFLFILVLFVAFLAVYRFGRVGGKIIKIDANFDKGFYTEYYLFIPDTMNTSEATYLLVEPNNTGFVDDDHKKHVDAAHDIIRFGHVNYIARELGVPLLVPCFDRPETNWEQYTHSLDRDTLQTKEGTLARIDEQLLAMIADARSVLAKQNIKMQDQILLDGFSASGSFVNRFTALHSEKVAGVAAGGINGMLILPTENMYGQELIYPIGVADLQEIANLSFQMQTFSAVPQFYYMGENDKNDALPYDDAYSDLEREIIINVLGEDMDTRWENCQTIYDTKGIQAVFGTYVGVGHETTPEIDADIIAFFRQVMNDSN